MDNSAAGWLGVSCERSEQIHAKGKPNHQRKAKKSANELV